MPKAKKRLKKSEILQEAIKYLAMDFRYELYAPDKERYICHTLNQVVFYCKSPKQVESLKTYIKELLVTDCGYGCDSYDEWLEVVHGVTFNERYKPEGFKKLQYSRKQWMLWMIEHFKQQCD